MMKMKILLIEMVMMVMNQNDKKRTTVAGFRKVKKLHAQEKSIHIIIPESMLLKKIAQTIMRY